MTEYTRVNLHPVSFLKKEKKSIVLLIPTFIPDLKQNFAQFRVTCRRRGDSSAGNSPCPILGGEGVGTARGIPTPLPPLFSLPPLPPLLPLHGEPGESSWQSVEMCETNLIT